MEGKGLEPATWEIGTWEDCNGVIHLFISAYLGLCRYVAIITFSALFQFTWSKMLKIQSIVSFWLLQPRQKCSQPYFHIFVYDCSYIMLSHININSIHLEQLVITFQEKLSCWCSRQGLDFGQDRWGGGGGGGGKHYETALT